MKNNIPYITQINENSCGAAVLEMVYRFYGCEASQQNIFDKYKQLEPHGTGNYKIDVIDLVSDAISRGFLSFWGRANYLVTEDCIELLDRLVNKSKIPVIVCQQFTKEQKEIGHFRVVVGINKNFVLVHDPHINTGGKDQKWPIEKFIDFWQPTGENVTGGVFVVIKNL